jgi:hypothetical protein
MKPLVEKNCKFPIMKKLQTCNKKNTTSKRKYKDIQEEIKKAQNNILCFKVESKYHYTKILKYIPLAPPSFPCENLL